MDRAADEDVSGAFSNGHPDALALVYERFGSLVYSIALRALGAKSDAEDVAQQVFVSAWRSRDSFDPERGTLGGWLVTITRNKVADAMRQRQRESRVLLRLSLAHATIHAGWHYVQVSGIVLTLTSTAASALDATFGTTLFKAGLELGTASTLLRY